MMRKEVEQKIIDLLKQGDNTAYKYVYDHYYTLLCAIAYEYLKDGFLCESMVDDLIFHLWEKRTTLEITTSLKSYLVRAIRNRCINYLKLERERREVTFSSMSAKESESVQYAQSSEYPLAVLLESELEEKIRQCVENLPEDCRNVYRKSRYEDKSHEQIARESGISINTVKYHIKNALARLKNDLAEYL